LSLRGPLTPRATPHHNASYQGKATGEYDQESNKRATTSDDSEQGIVDEESPCFKSADHTGLLGEPEWDLGKVDHQHIAITLEIVASSVAGRQNRGCIGDLSFGSDQAGSEQIGPNTPTFQIYRWKNMVGRKMRRAAQFNPVIIGRLSNPEQFCAYVGGGLPESNMPAVLDVVGGLFKRQVLGMPKNVEVTHRRGRVTSVGEAVNGNLRGGLGSNRGRE
jgi:hypothetical protein